MSKNAPPTDTNKKTWTANLMRFRYSKTSRRHTTVESLSQMSKIPKEQHILDRYKNFDFRTEKQKENSNSSR